MPEFITHRPHWMPSPRTAKERRIFERLGSDGIEFATAYVEALFFTNGDSGDDDDFSLNALGAERLTRESKFTILEDCGDFLNTTLTAEEGGTRDVRDTIAKEPGGFGQAGHDFRFTRQGHGTGFWARGADVWGAHAREQLTASAAKFRETQVFRTAHGWIVYG